MFLFNLTAPNDRFTLEHPTEEQKVQQERYEFYRIIIMQSPRYTKAAHHLLHKKDLTAHKHGEIIEGSTEIIFMHYQCCMISIKQN